MAQVSTYWFNLGPFTHLLFVSVPSILTLRYIGERIHVWWVFIYPNPWTFYETSTSFGWSKSDEELKAQRSHPHVCCWILDMPIFPRPNMDCKLVKDHSSGFALFSRRALAATKWCQVESGAVWESGTRVSRPFQSFMKNCSTLLAGKSQQFKQSIFRWKGDHVQPINSG